MKKGRATKFAEKYLHKKKEVKVDDVANTLEKTIRRDAIVYGPVDSRRLGKSLGINLVQGGWHCNWGCIYCEYIPEHLRNKQFYTSPNIHWTKPHEVESYLRAWFEENKETHIDSITFAGNTEPLLNKDFNEILEVVLKLRQQYRPRVKVSLFTNGWNVKGITLEKLDVVFLKLDAGNQQTFERINQTRMSLSELVRQLCIALPKKKTIQSMFVGGPDGNLDEKNINDYVQVIKEIKPQEVGLYSMLYTHAAKEKGYDIRPATDKELCVLAKRIRKEMKTQIWKLNVVVYRNDRVIGKPRIF